MLDIKNYLKILNSQSELLTVIKNELKEINKEFSTPRRTEIIGIEEEEEDDIHYIQKEDIVITVSHNGYIKRSPLISYRAQNRG